MSVTSKLLDHPLALCNMVRRIAQEAGTLTLDYFDDLTDMAEGLDHKADGSPVTRADREAEALITAALADIIAGIPVVAEEATAAGNVPDIAGLEYFWLVDPLDGTREFVTGSPEYTINIALIKNGDPILGVIYAPAKGELYAGCGPGTAVRYLEDQDSEKSLRVRSTPRSGLVVMASRAHGDKAQLDAFLESHKVAKMVHIGSSLKFCAIAAAKADMYPRFGPTCEWDVAAGDAILRAAGASVNDLSGV
ncbi:MAG: 3'(2'),5'-bisphosphate nucleotidase CysQ, partial [Alphaproteobacteria bacterium]|nr:3'(2'),5'-bisphosphate nucleotidase CysQ [Alphaproteobacteria bacterium]